METTFSRGNLPDTVKTFKKTLIFNQQFINLHAKVAGDGEGGWVGEVSRRAGGERKGRKRGKEEGREERGNAKKNERGKRDKGMLILGGKDRRKRSHGEAKQWKEQYE